VFKNCFSRRRMAPEVLVQRNLSSRKCIYTRVLCCMQVADRICPAYK
jgi:hypothetical protein